MEKIRKYVSVFPGEPSELTKEEGAFTIGPDWL